eukprot:scaffold41123_cov103-Phaeocystis_antarctica.AAC.1
MPPASASLASVAAAAWLVREAEGESMPHAARPGAGADADAAWSARLARMARCNSSSAAAAPPCRQTATGPRRAPPSAAAACPGRSARALPPPPGPSRVYTHPPAVPCIYLPISYKRNNGYTATAVCNTPGSQEETVVVSCPAH